MRRLAKFLVAIILLIASVFAVRQSNAIPKADEWLFDRDMREWKVFINRRRRMR